MREYQVVAVNPEDLEDGIKDARLLALRKEGYRTIAVLPVEHRGQPRLAFVLEPPTSAELPAPPTPVPFSTDISNKLTHTLFFILLVVSLGLSLWAVFGR